jgi:hypothetical protein
LKSNGGQNDKFHFSCNLPHCFAVVCAVELDRKLISAKVETGILGIK